VSYKLRRVVRQCGVVFVLQRFIVYFQAIISWSGFAFLLKSSFVVSALELINSLRFIEM
jgi:hypothetical protein